MKNLNFFRIAQISEMVRRCHQDTLNPNIKKPGFQIGATLSDWLTNQNRMRGLPVSLSYSSNPINEHFQLLDVL